MKKRIFAKSVLLLLVLSLLCLICFASCKKQPTEPSDNTPTHQHTPSEWSVKTEPTCTEEGLRVKTCTDCGKELSSEVIAKAEHTLNDWVVKTEPTCTETGVRVKICAVCEKEISSETIFETDHTESDWIIDKEPAAGVEGKKHTECTVCHTLIKSEKIDALPIPHEHTPGEWSVTKSPSCTEKGEQVKLCTGCGEILEIAEIEKTSHTEGDWIIDKPATVGVAGEKHTECNVCHTVMKTETIPALEEDKPHEHSPGLWQTTKEATCTEYGEKKRFCLGCGEVVDTARIDKKAHTKSDWIIDTPADVGVVGKKHTECIVCHTVMDRADIPALEPPHSHTEGDWTVTRQPTCVTEGEKVKYCTDSTCGEILATDSIPVVSHTEGDWTVTRQPTCSEEGEKVKYCQVSDCGKVLAKESISTTSHTEGDWIVDKSAYFGIDGEKHTECTVCHTVIRTETIPALEDNGEKNTYENINYNSIYVPTKGALEVGLEYDWDPDNLTMDLASSSAKIALKNNIKASVLSAMGGTSLTSYNRFMVLEGSGAFDLSGFYFTKGYNYSIEIEYYSNLDSANSYLIAYNGQPGNREVAKDIFKKGHHTICLDYRVESGETGLTFYTNDRLEVYIGKITVHLASSGPTLAQMKQESGYNWPIDQLKVGSSSKIQISSISNSTVKNALLAAGHKETDYVVNTTGGDLAGFDRSPLFVPGYKYTITIEYYAIGSGGHLIALDSTAGNHSFAGSAFANGYNTSVYNWEVGKNGEYAVTFYSIPEIYIASVNFKLEVPDKYATEIYKEPTTLRVPSLVEINNGHTFDFTVNEIPVIDGGKWIDISAIPSGVDKYADLKSMFTSANSFNGRYAYYAPGNIALNFMRGAIIAGKTYTVSMRVYCPEGSPSMIVLPMNSAGVQCGDTDVSNVAVSAVAGKTGVYDVSFSATVGSETYYFMTYYSNTPYYISSITIKAPGSYTPPTSSGNHPEYNYTPTTPEPNKSYGNVTLSELISIMSSSIYKSDMAVSEQAGITDASAIGIDKTKVDEILYPVPANSQFAEIYNVADYGVLPTNSGETNSANFTKLLRELRASKALKKVYFKEGVYKFAGTLNFESIDNVYFCSESANKRFTILMTNWVQGLSVTNCKNIHFNNFNFDYETPTTISGVIVDSKGSEKVVIKVHDEFDLTHPNYNGGNFMYANPSYMEYKYDSVAGKYVPDPYGNLLYGKDCLTSASYNKSTHELTIYTNSSGRPANQTQKLQFTNGTEISLSYTMYEYFGFYGSKSENIYFEQVNWYHTAGMAMGFGNCHNLYLNGVKLSPDPNSTRHMTATADGFHPANTTGEIVVTNCVFELSHDDSMNVKGSYQDIVASHPYKIFYNPSTNVGTQVGDKIEIYRRSDYKLLGTYTVTEVDDINCVYTVKERVTTDLAGQRMCNVTRINSLTIRNTFIGNKRNRGMLLQCRDIEISNCTFMNIVHNPIQVLSEGLVYEVEGIMPGNVKIYNNKFINNCARDIVVYARGRDGSRAAGSIRDVQIYNNFFSGQDAGPIEINATSDSSVKNNLFAGLNVSNDYAVYLWRAKNITVSGNVVVKKPGQTLNVLRQGNNVSGITDSGNTLLELSTDAGPTKSQLTSSTGYDFDISKTEIGKVAPTTVGTITDEAAKAAILGVGYTESDAMIPLFEDGILGDFNAKWRYTPGYTYTVTITYYSTATGGYLIALDDTDGNHAFAGPGAFETGMHTSTYTWVVGDKNEYELIFYQVPGVYILDMNFKLVE